MYDSFFQMQVRHGGVGVNELERDFTNLSFEPRDVSIALNQNVVNSILYLKKILKECMTCVLQLFAGSVLTNMFQW